MQLLVQNSRDVEEQVHAEAEGYVDAVEQAVAWEFVATIAWTTFSENRFCCSGIDY